MWRRRRIKYVHFIYTERSVGLHETTRCHNIWLSSSARVSLTLTLSRFKFMYNKIAILRHSNAWAAQGMRVGGGWGVIARADEGQKMWLRPATSLCKNIIFSWFQTFAVLWMLYSFLQVILRRLNFMCRRFGTLYFIFIRGVSLHHQIQTPGIRGSVRSTRGLGPTMTARDQSIGISIGILPQTLIMSITVQKTSRYYTMEFDLEGF